MPVTHISPVAVKHLIILNIIFVQSNSEDVDIDVEDLRVQANALCPHHILQTSFTNINTNI